MPAAAHAPAGNISMRWLGLTAPCMPKPAFATVYERQPFQSPQNHAILMMNNTNAGQTVCQHSALHQLLQSAGSLHATKMLCANHSLLLLPALNAHVLPSAWLQQHSRGFSKACHPWCTKPGPGVHNSKSLCAHNCLHAENGLLWHPLALSNCMHCRVNKIYALCEQ